MSFGTPRREVPSHEANALHVARLARVEVRQASGPPQAAPRGSLGARPPRSRRRRPACRRRAATPPRSSRRLGSGTRSGSRRRACRAARTRRRRRGPPRRPSPTGAARRRRVSAPTRGATTASRARSRTAGCPPRRGRRPCHAGGAARSFSPATSRGGRSRASVEPLAEHLAQRLRLLADGRPDLDVRDGSAGLEHPRETSRSASTLRCAGTSASGTAPRRSRPRGPAAVGARRTPTGRRIGQPLQPAAVGRPGQMRERAGT